MAPPSFQWVWNPTTILAAVNLAAFIFIGGGMIASLRNQDNAQAAQIVELRAMVVAEQVRGMATEINMGRIDERMIAMQSSLARIEAAVRDTVP